MAFSSAVCLLLVATMALANPVQKFASGNQALTANIYREMTKIETGNFLVCPISLEVIMALALSGARGETANELAKGLNLPKDKNELEAMMSAVVPTLKGNDRYALSSANRMFVKEGFKISQSFQNTAVNVFNAGIENVDFSQKVQASNHINKWVETKTNNLIHDLISADDISEATRLILVNALHFKGKWAHPFDGFGTFKRDFHVTASKKVKVDMMSQTSNFNYYEDTELNAKFLEMPYEGGDISMTIVLPNEIEGLAALEGRIQDVFTPKQYNNVRVNVQIPKFTMESSVQFKPILNKLGVNLPFSDEADLSGITGAPDLKIDKIIQKTFINVTEEGTEAAAATAVFVGLASAPIMPVKPKYFIADRPFIFLINMNSGSVAFFGRYSKN